MKRSENDAFYKMSTIWAGVGPDRKRGLRILPKEGGYFVHVTSRATQQRFLLGEKEKWVLLDLVRKWADFSGISVVTHCLMDNHFHLLLYVPERMEVGYEEVLRRLKRVWPAKKVEYWQAFYENQRGERKSSMLAALTDRMYDLPAFMRIVKQSFSSWYNRRHSVKGNFWEGRYRSVVVENTPLALMSVAAYVDLNPLRANLCEDPLTYRWCGYGEACGGGELARAGLDMLVRLARGHQPAAALHVRRGQLNREMHWKQVGAVLQAEHCRRAAPKGWAEVQAAYRIWLVHKGTSQKDNPRAKRAFQKRKGFDPVQVVAEFERQGEVPMAMLLRQRMRYFTQGVAIGGQAYLESLFKEYRGCFGPKRTKAGRNMKGGCWPGMQTMRQVE
ncbi:MAG: hypothetical protein JJU29_07370 [Verrucomicrobia bacterium]|nr:hypothetical protein [Verrucomicrobiota bacterium]MCH8512238.1 hypothetical protein [Kiritimatiellia bacterium]